MLNLRQALQASPQLFPFQLDERTDAVRFIALLERDYTQASFLDGRMLTANSRSALIPWQEVRAAADGLPLRCHFIFHISHAGSTLLSRLIGSHSDCFSLREPLILRLLAEGKYSERMDCFLGLWSRTFHSNQTPVVKATSFVSQIGPALMERSGHSRAVLMYVPATSFIPSLLDGAMLDVSSQANSRMARLQSRGILPGVTLAELSDGELVAMSWLAEMVSLTDVASQFPTRTLWLNFEDFLLQTDSHMAKVREHFQLIETKEPLVDPQLMQHYAKRPDVSYNSLMRIQLINQANQKFGTEINRGLTWLARHLPAIPNVNFV